uniref:C-type lectin domain-containing protein n=1 Tax=Heterorhabditis bacteriophora TaxID=37862 RepID=A0A1I7WHI2_HETBA
MTENRKKRKNKVAIIYERTVLLHKFSHISTHPWIGYTDANEEGIVKGINDKFNTIWPPSLPLLTRKNDVQDCLYLDYTHINQNPYQIEDCRIRQTFICQKLSNWSTIVVGSQNERLRNGSKPASADFTFWLLILVAFILLLILLCIICQALAKKREQNRIHSSEGNQLVRGMDGTHSAVNMLSSSPDTNIQRRAEVIHHSETSNKVLPTHVHAHTELQQTAPREVIVLPSKEVKLPRLVEEPETRLAELARPKEETEGPYKQSTQINIHASSAPVPRTLPPLPIRESTFLTLNTRQVSNI